MRFESVAIAFSGASLMVMGKAFERNVDYQATCDLLEELSLGSGEVVFVERFSKVVERRSTFTLIGEGGAA
jgi:hypothetical protein